MTYMETPRKLEWDDTTNTWVPAVGKAGASFVEWDGSKWVEGKNPEGPGALRRGFATGMEQVKGTLADVIPAMAQQALGYDEAAKRNLEEYKARMEALRAQNLLAETDYRNVKDVSSALTFAGEAIGQTLPSLATSIFGGVGVGAAAARLGAGRLLSGQVAKRAAELEGRTLAGEVLTKEAALAIATKEAANKAGIAAGAFGGSALLNIPESYQSLAEAGNASLGAAFAVGTLKSTLDALGPIRLLARTRGPEFSDKLTDLISARLLKNKPGVAGAVGGTLETAALEGLTEGSQQLLDEAAAAVLADKSIDWDQVLNAALIGGVGAAPVGTVAGGLGARAKAARDKEAEAQREADLLAKQREADLRAQEESYQTYAGQRLTGEYQPPAPEKTGLDFLKEAASEVRNKYDLIPIQITKDGEVSVAPQDIIKLAQQLKSAGNTTPLPKLVKSLQASIESDVMSVAADLKAGEPVQKFVESLEPTAGQKPVIFDRLEESNKLVAEIQSDPGLLELPGVRQQYEEAKTFIRDAAEKAAAEKKLAEEGIPEVGTFGLAPSRKGTPAEIEATETTTAYVEPAEEKAAPISLTTFEKKEVEDLIRELPRGQTLSIASVQQRLSDVGKPVSLEEARGILQTYIPQKFPIGKALPEDAVLGVPASLRLREEDGQFVKTGVAEEAFREEAPTLTSEMGGARAFPEVTPTIETTSPVTKIQGLLQNIPLGLSQETWGGIANNISKMNPRKILTLADLQAAAGPGVKLFTAEAKQLWESLVNAGVVAKAGLGYRVKDDAPIVSQYIDNVVGSTTTVKPKAITGAGMVPQRTRQQLYALGYTREDIAALTPDEAQNILTNKKKKSILKAESGVSRRGFLAGLLASAVAFTSGANATTPASKELVFHLRNNDVSAALKHISENSSNPVFRKLASMLVQGGMGRMQMRVVSVTPSGIQDAIRFGYGDADTLQSALRSPRFLGYVDLDKVDTPTLILFDRETGETGLSEEIFLHEAVHGWVMGRWRTINNYPMKGNAEKMGYQRNPKDVEIINELGNLYRSFRLAVEKQFGANSPEFKQSALRNFDEFLAYGLTDPKFRDLLSSFDYRPNAYIPITPVGRGAPSFFDKIYNYILKLFKITPTQFRTLDEFQRITDKLLSTSTPPDFDVASRFAQRKKSKQDDILRSKKETIAKDILDQVTSTSRRGFLRGLGPPQLLQACPEPRLWGQSKK